MSKKIKSKKRPQSLADITGEAICIKDLTLRGKDGSKWDIKRGQTVTIARRSKKDWFIMGRYWGPVPRKYFAGFRYSYRGSTPPESS